MTAPYRRCLYCSRAFRSEDRVALCDRCLTAHHEECWERNGRCSTFRCNGQPRTLRGDDLAATLQALLERSNDGPRVCPFCGSATYPGVLQSRTAPQPNGAPPRIGLQFVAEKAARAKARKGLKAIGAMLGGRSWFLPGAQVRSRSCGKCHRLFLGGRPVGEEDARQGREEQPERHCPHCAVALWSGQIALRAAGPARARFQCDGVPDFHSDWFGHNVLDRFVLNRWSPLPRAVVAQSCPECHYTEVDCRPIYRTT